jgi:Nitrile hydratase beta subunit
MERATAKFKVGDAVVIARENPTGNPRTPEYVRGKRGVIGAVHGILENPKDHRGLYQPLYTIRFDLRELLSADDHDSVWVDVHEEWLRALHPSG